MKIELKVPAMGESISEASIGAVFKPSGSSVSMDEEILELETDKVNQVLHASKAGILNLTVKQGDTVKIGQIIGYIDLAGKEPEQKNKEQVIDKRIQAPKGGIKPESPACQARSSKEDFIAELTQPYIPQQEHVVNQPVQCFDKRVTRRKMSKIRRIIAERLVQSQQSSAMLTTFNEIDMSQVISLRENYKEEFTKKHGVRLGFMSFFVKASVAALKACPGLNSYIDGDEIVHLEYYDIGIAVGTERGLIVPVVRNCDCLSFAEIEKSIEGYSRKAKEGGLLVDDLQGGGFTITNGGVYGSLLSTPILNHPQSGILGMHKIEKRAVVVGDQIVVRPMMYVALSYDHRIVDGKEAVAFLVLIKQLLEDPARLVLDI